jgi:Ca2+-transporting ATPase
MAVGTLAVIAWATTAFPSDNDAVARTMGFTTFSIANLAFSWATKDEIHSVFSADVIQDRYFIITTLLSIASIFLAVNLNVFQNFLDTTELTADQWLICIVVGLAIILVSEVRKLVWKKPLDEEPQRVVPAAAEAAPAA